METRRWTNPSQPQTLQIAVFLLYFRAFFGLLESLVFGVSPLFALIAIGQGVAANGIANEKRWGYSVGVAMSLAPAALRVLAYGPGGLLSVNPITLLFEVALIALLLHPQSRDYQRIWFS